MAVAVDLLSKKLSGGLNALPYVGVSSRLATVSTSRELKSTLVLLLAGIVLTWIGGAAEGAGVVCNCEEVIVSGPGYATINGTYLYDPSIIPEELTGIDAAWLGPVSDIFSIPGTTLNWAFASTSHGQSWIFVLVIRDATSSAFFVGGDFSYENSPPSRCEIETGWYGGTAPAPTLSCASGDFKDDDPPPVPGGTGCGVNRPPVPNAGLDHGGCVGDRVFLDGSLSFDPDEGIPPNVIMGDLNIPLGFSSPRVSVLPDLVVSPITKHGPDHTNHVSSKSTNSLVVGLALGTLTVVVGLRLRYTPVVVGHGCHHGRLAAGVDLAWNPYPAYLAGLVG